MDKVFCHGNLNNIYFLKGRLNMIGLYGIGGLYNFGCEAIVRGTYAYIKKTSPNEKVIYYTPNWKYDRKKLADLDIEIININKKGRVVRKIINRILSELGIKKRIILDNWKKVVLNVDCIYSIGGDMYTIPRRFWNETRFDYYNNLVEFSKYAQKKKKKIVIFGASIGPFGEMEVVNNYYISSLKEAEHIYCRENITLEYLLNKGLTNCSFLPDPAFLVKGNFDYDKENEKKYIGINLSPLSLVEAFGEYNDKTICKFAAVLESVLLKINIPIKLIPHVLSNRKNDNDYAFLRKVKQNIDKKYEDMIEIVDDDLGFIGTKNVLQDCYIVVSTRMHCCINALCEGVPALFVSYSKKAIGMAEYFYGNQKNVIEISDIEEMVPAIERILGEYDLWKQFVEKRIVDVKKEFDYIQKNN